MKHLPLHIDETQALALFRRRGWLTRLRSRLRDGTGILPVIHGLEAHATPKFRIELLWLPVYLVPFKVTSRDGPGTIDVSVEACSGAFAIFQMHPDIVEGAPPGEKLPRQLTEKEAAAMGRERLLQTILRQRSRGPKPIIEGMGTIELLRHPFWVYYHERRPGTLDIKLIDAATGEKGGAKTKVGILRALAQVSNTP